MLNPVSGSAIFADGNKFESGASFGTGKYLAKFEAAGYETESREFEIDADGWSLS